MTMFRFFNGDNLRIYELMLKEVRALANHELAGVIEDRESENAAWYERERLGWLERLEKNSAANAPHPAGTVRGKLKRTPHQPKNMKKEKVRP
jgi:hypothetical protein